MKPGLNKHQIIRRAADFNRLFKEGKRYSSTFFLLFAADSEQAKFGVAVSSKVASAVKRNRARRKTKEILRLHQERLPKNKDLILLAKPTVVLEPQSRLIKDFQTLLDKVTQNK